jgi:hypothetical protein
VESEGFIEGLVADQDDGGGYGLFVRVYHKGAEIHEGVSFEQLCVVDYEDWIEGVRFCRQLLDMFLEFYEQGDGSSCAVDSEDIGDSFEDTASLQTSVVYPCGPVAMGVKTGDYAGCEG